MEEYLCFVQQLDRDSDRTCQFAHYVCECAYVDVNEAEVEVEVDVDVA